jgi:hypothetical protein
MNGITGGVHKESVVCMFVVCASVPSKGRCTRAKPNVTARRTRMLEKFSSGLSSSYRVSSASCALGPTDYTRTIGKRSRSLGEEVRRHTHLPLGGEPSDGGVVEGREQQHDTVVVVQCSHFLYYCHDGLRVRSRTHPRTTYSSCHRRHTLAALMNLEIVLARSFTSAPITICVITHKLT